MLRAKVDSTFGTKDALWVDRHSIRDVLHAIFISKDPPQPQVVPASLERRFGMREFMIHSGCLFRGRIIEQSFAYENPVASWFCSKRRRASHRRLVARSHDG